MMYEDKTITLTNKVSLKIRKTFRQLPKGTIVDVLQFQIMSGNGEMLKPTKNSFYAILGYSEDNLKTNSKFDLDEATEEMEYAGVNDTSFKEMLDFMNKIWSEKERNKTIYVKEKPTIKVVIPTYTQRFGFANTNIVHGFR